MQNELYSNATKSTIDAIKSDAKTANQYQSAGGHCRAYFGTESSMLEAKAQFIADAILPALDKKHTQALAKELPRKGSKEYNALDQSGRDTWESANQAKKDARAIAHTYFARLVSYAFPKEKTETAPRELRLRVSEELIALIKACRKVEQNAESEGFNIIECIAHMEKALASASVRAYSK